MGAPQYPNTVVRRGAESPEKMGSGDVDTDKFASWPLLRPDELATIPSDVLQASLAALDLLCGQSSDGKLCKWWLKRMLRVLSFFVLGIPGTAVGSTYVGVYRVRACAFQHDTRLTLGAAGLQAILVHL